MSSFAPVTYVRRLALAWGVCGVVLLSYNGSVQPHQRIKTSHLLSLVFLLPAAYVTLDHLVDRVLSKDPMEPCPLTGTDRPDLGPVVQAVVPPVVDQPTPPPLVKVKETLPDTGDRPVSAEEQFERFQQIVTKP